MKTTISTIVVCMSLGMLIGFAILVFQRRRPNIIVEGAVSIAPMSQRAINAIAHPGYGSCKRCERTWDVVDGHTTMYGQAKGRMKEGDGPWIETAMPEGCFPLCNECWEDLKTGEARLPFYRQLVTEWAQWDRLSPKEPPSEAKWPAIRAAVLRGE